MDNQQTGGQPSAIAGLPFSEAAKAGQVLYISGQVGVGGSGGQDDANNTFAVEVAQVMTNLGGVLQRNGLKYGHLVMVTIYLTDMSSYAEANRVYSGYFQGAYPARVCIAVKELPLRARIEISAIARMA